MSDALKSLEAYGRYVADLIERFAVKRSTVTVWSISKYMGVVEGEIFLEDGYRLRIREEIDFAAGLIVSYGYEAYQGDKRLYWYDDFPHPNDPTLAETYPHHKHIPPNIKQNRVPAPNIKFDRPNLAGLLEEITRIKQGNKEKGTPKPPKDEGK